ncbi:hypothetical protein NUU61_000524 [Penicillium alfredii]|uniref:RRM domain-containing protein n=1 Tax=Penicillium alfredii TaxID=1506179 RepID=A0A9W9KQR7_9EURO|nr:uncharacterized protein NUU61_000524 [Penicillium alfredii]KAJ5114765.1 hypothetical protein NUU61_000524 [Penicillium alfredii]
MATEDDNFDIDIYGDGSYNANDQGQDDAELVLDAPENPPQAPRNDESSEPKQETQQTSVPNGDHNNMPVPLAHDLPAPPHGVKRKEYDDRQADPDATTALLLSDLFWWTTDDDIRGWVNQAQCEDELKDVTFSEHKVNGKSKGQAFVEFTTPQAATSTKHQIEANGATGRKYMVNYTNPHTNPFRTLPKDTPMRKDGNRGFNTGANQNMNFGMNNNMGGGFRGRGGYNNNRGMGGNFNNRGNFNNPMGFQGGGAAAPAGGMMGGFQGAPMGGMQNYGFNNRGNMMGGGMRGGPGGMRGGRGQGFQGPNPAFNQGFFNPNQGGGDASWNPHGAKRSRQE